jgi:hypothetical protein
MSPNHNDFQFDDRVAQVKTFFDNIEAGHLNGKPLHVADPAKSLFDIICAEEFINLSAKQIQSRLRYKNIVVTGMEHPNMKFDKGGLLSFCTMDQTISIQGKV